VRVIATLLTESGCIFYPYSVRVRVADWVITGFHGSLINFQGSNLAQTGPDGPGYGIIITSDPPPSNLISSYVMGALRN
jgi:hypothetical protein